MNFQTIDQHLFDLKYQSQENFFNFFLIFNINTILEKGDYFSLDFIPIFFRKNGSCTNLQEYSVKLIILVAFIMCLYINRSFKIRFIFKIIDILQNIEVTRRYLQATLIQSILLDNNETNACLLKCPNLNVSTIKSGFILSNKEPYLYENTFYIDI